jgi:hypothetical protein
MNRHPNHCACPRCGSQLPTTEFKKAAAIAKLKHLPDNWKDREIIARQGWTFTEEESFDD